MKPSLRIALVLVCAVLVPIIPFVAIGELPGERWLEATREDAVRFGLTGAALLAGDVLLPIPSSVVGALLGGRLGFWLGLCCGWLGLCAGNAVGYALGRLMPARFASDVPRAAGLSAVFLSRPVPVLAEALALSAGAERLPFGPFMLAAGLGNLCYAGAMAANGAALMADGVTGAGLLVPMALPVFAWWVWKVRKRHA